MIVGVGIDQVEVERMDGVLRRHPERAARRLFTAGERDLCGARSHPAECYAARFAAKEALFKALGTGWTRGLRWRDIEVVTDGEGCPELRLRGRAAELMEERGASRVHVSFSHDGGLAVAMVVLEGGAGTA